MKKLIICLMALMLVMTGAMAQEASIDESKAKELAMAAFMGATGLGDRADEFMVSCQLVTPGEGQSPLYSCMVRYIGAPNARFEVQIDAGTGIVLACAADGTVREQLERYEIMLNAYEQVGQATAEWEKKLGPHEFWDYRDRYAFVSQYGYDPVHSTDETKYKVSFDTLYMTADPLLLPEDGDLSYEQAFRLAKQELKDTYKLTDEQIDAFGIGSALIGSEWSSDIADNRYWNILFRSKDVLDVQGRARLVYQVMVSTPSGLINSARMFTAEDLMALGLNETTASYLTELGALCYVPQTGRFFHTDRDCSGVMPEDKPMTEFLTGLLEIEPYKSLLPCPICVPQ